MDRGTFDRMLDTLAHRGPDGRGVHVYDGGAVMLGHRRLAIIDLSAAGSQPMTNEDGTVWITCNGEIYNYRELRTQLRRLGHQFRSDSDTEIIVHAYEEWGLQCLPRLRGIFAFGLWDSRRRTLLLARDPLGVKPLYYARYGERLTFASQPKAILADPDFPRALDREGLRDYVAFGYVPFDRSAFAGMRKLPAAHAAVFSDGELQLSRFWELRVEPRLTDPKVAATTVRERLVDAVKSQLASDVSVGCFLSGGIDSSLLVGLASPHIRELRSFTIGFTEAVSDERDYARAVARHFGTRHFEDVTERPQVEKRLWELQDYYDEPFDLNGPMPFFDLARLARANGTVVTLGGDGADEMFVGYLRYEDFDRPAWLRPGPMAGLWRRLRSRAWLAPRTSAPGDLERYLAYEGYLTDSAQQRLFTGCFTDGLPNRASDLATRFHRPDLPAVAAAQYLDMHLYLVDHILCKVDRASMAHGVEVRVPYLDPDLVACAFQVPLGIHFRKGERKALLKRIAAQYLPASAITPRKKGFSSPLGIWLDARARGWMARCLHDGALMGHGVLRGDWEIALRGLGLPPEQEFRVRWLIFGAELWARRWLAGQTDMPGLEESA
jgi:asparagine synthase (glutamine-hydrolysing)